MNQNKKFLNVPDINSIKDLIDMANSGFFYKNINNILLWEISPYLKMLNNLVGMHSLKKSLMYQILYYLQGMQSNDSNEYMHSIILGPPGCGKTTVGRILAYIYRSMNLFSHTKLPCEFIQARRDDFIAEYLGQTSVKTYNFLNSCIGSILFIDEAYSLGDGDKKDSFSKEAIDTLNLFLSTHSKNFCCIIAGYESDIKRCFLDVNPGMESRFPWVHRIDNYTTQDLVDIFLNRIEYIEWRISIENLDIVLKFNENIDLFENKGRDVLNFVTRCKMIHSKRVFGQNYKNKYIITKDDFINAIDMFRKSRIEPVYNRRCGYETMYS